MKTMKTVEPGVPAAATDCLLTYRFSTDPEPLQVSTAQTAVAGRINLAVFGGDQTVYCNQIKIAVPVGSEATDFSEDTPSDSVSTAKWTVESREIVPGTELGIDDPGDYAAYTFKTRDASDNKIDYNLVFGLSATVNKTPGSFSYVVQEHSGTESDPSTYTSKQATFALGKDLPRFYLKNFVATAPGSPTVPASEFANGADIRLSWESNGTYFRIYRKGEAQPVYAGSKSEFTLDGGAATDTTFILVASVTGDPSGDGGSGYEPVYLYEALTVTISNPDLTPKSTAVAGNASVGGTLGVTGASTLHDTTVDGTLGVSGAATLAGASVSGDLGVSGSASFDKATAKQLTVDGGASVSGTLLASEVRVGGPVTASSLNVTVGNTSLRSASVGSLIMTGGKIYINDVGNNNALQAFNSSPKAFSGYFENKATRSGHYITGVGSKVAHNSESGFGTNGKYVSFAGDAVLTHLPTNDGFRVVTSPLSLEAEVHLSGRARLSKGKAVVEFDSDMADVIHHSDAEPYRVLLTPTDPCMGLAAIEKHGDRFVVEELGDGESDAGFDWFVIARKPEALGAAAPQAMPEKLPEMPPPEGVDAPAEDDRPEG